MKFRALFLLATTLPLAAFSGQAETINDALLKCKNTDNSLKRLVCYDRVVRDMNQYSGTQEAISRTVNLPPRPPASVAPRAVEDAPVQARQPQTQFGLEHKASTENLDSSLVATVTALSKAARGEIIVTLDNGTVWKQTNDVDLKLSVGQTVVIERGILGAFYATVDGMKKRMKVKRVK